MVADLVHEQHVSGGSRVSSAGWRIIVTGLLLVVGLMGITGVRFPQGRASVQTRNICAMATFRPLDMIARHTLDGHDTQYDPPETIYVNLDTVLYFRTIDDGENALAEMANGTSIHFRGSPSSFSLPTGA